MLKEILFISHKYPPAVGGMEKFSYELIQGFNKKSTIVHTYVYKGGISKIKWFFQLKSEIRKILSNNPSIQIIHLNDGLMAVFCRWIHHEFNIPVVATLHGLDVVFPLSIYQKKILPSFNKAFHSFICVSRATAEAAKERGISKNKLHVIANGVDHEIANLPINQNTISGFFERIDLKDFNNKIIIVGLGRGVRRKGYGWFVKNVLPDLNKDIVFIMLGPRTSYERSEPFLKKILPTNFKKNIELLLGLSTDDATLIAAAKDKSLLGRYFRPGYLPFNEVSQILKSAHLFVMPNLKEEGDMEGFGLVALEASLCGTLVLASQIDGITDAVIENKNGLLIESGNKEVWIKVINELSENKDSLKAKGKEGLSFTLNHFSWTKMVENYFQYFENILYQKL